MTAIRSVESLKYGAGLFVYLLAVLVVGGGLLGLGLELGYAEATDLAGTGTLDTISKTDLAAGGVLSILGSFVLLTGVFGILHKLVADSVAAGISAGAPTTAASGSEPDVDRVNADEPETEESSGAPTASERSESTTPETTPDSESVSESPSPAAESEAETAESAPSTTSSATEREKMTEPDETTLSEMFDESDEGERVEPPQSSRAEQEAETDPESGPDETTTGASTEADSQSPASTAESEAAERTQSPREPTPEEIAFGTNPSDDTEATDDEDAIEDESVAEPDRTAESGSGKSVGNTSGKDPLADPDE